MPINFNADGGDVTTWLVLLLAYRSRPRDSEKRTLGFKRRVRLGGDDHAHGRRQVAGRVDRPLVD